jgi:hypothetical protein
MFILNEQDTRQIAYKTYFNVKDEGLGSNPSKYSRGAPSPLRLCVLRAVGSGAPVNPGRPLRLLFGFGFLPVTTLSLAAVTDPRACIVRGGGCQWGAKRGTRCERRGMRWLPRTNVGTESRRNSRSPSVGIAGYWMHAAPSKEGFFTRVFYWSVRHLGYILFWPPSKQLIGITYSGTPILPKLSFIIFSK